MKFNLENSRPLALVLDLQELFTSANGPFENAASDKLIANVNALLARMRAKQIPVVFSSYVLADDLSDAGLLKDNPIVQQGFFCASSDWVKWDKRLHTASADMFISRNRPSPFWGGALSDLLESFNADVLLLCGLSVNNAISSAARDAFARDIPTVIIKDCTGAAPWEKHLDIYFEILDNWTAQLLSSEQLFAGMRLRKRP